MLTISLLLAAAPTLPQDLLVTRHAPARVATYSMADGSLIDDMFIDVDGLLGLAGATQNLWDVEVHASGEIWVGNYNSQSIYRFSSDGSAYLGDAPVAVGRVVGFALDANDLWAASVGGNATAGAWEFDLGAGTSNLAVTATNIWDTVPYGSDILLCRSTGVVERLDPTTMIVTPFASPGGFCEQVYLRANGGLLVANFGTMGYDEIDANGSVTASHTSLGGGSVRGVADLSNGNVLLNGTGGVHIYEPGTGTLTLLDSGSGAFIGSGDGGLLGNVYCLSNANSTGNRGELGGTGSNLIASNDVTLTASTLPANAFGFFLASRMSGFVPNPAGSTGILCLGGSIGRYVGPGEIQNSGAAGAILIGLDLTAMPQPTGPVGIAPGETWFFQAWFRDAIGGNVTSNFTNGLEVVFQ